MSELDDLLISLRDEPVSATFAGLDRAVTAGLACRQEAQLSRRSLALAGVVAVFVGASTIVMPGHSGPARPLIGIPDSAPSHLLVD